IQPPRPPRPQTKSQDIDGPHHIGVQVQGGIAVGTYQRSLASDVENGVQAAVEHPLELVEMSASGSYVLRASRHIASTACRLVVENYDIVTFFEKAVGHMRSDEAGSSCDQDSHAAFS